METVSTQRFITFPWFFRDCSAAKTSLWELKDPSTPVPIWWDFPSAIDLTKALIRKKSAPSCPPVFTYNRKFLIKSNSYLGFGDFQHLIYLSAFNFDNSYRWSIHVWLDVLRGCLSWSVMFVENSQHKIIPCWSIPPNSR